MMNHRAKEEKEDKEIWPATPKHVLSEKSKGEVMFCEGLDCGGEKESLTW